VSYKILASLEGEEPVAELACFGPVVKSLVVEVLIGRRADYVSAPAQRVPVRFSRSSLAVLLFPVAGADLNSGPKFRSSRARRPAALPLLGRH
jgi:hypothetical protein